MNMAMPSRSNQVLFAATDQDSYQFAGPITVTAGSSQQLTLDIEAGTVAGSIDKPNEDAYAVRRFGSAIAIAVFDGATSLKSIPALDRIEMSGARFASHFLRDQFLKLPSFSNSTLPELNQLLAQAVANLEGMDLRDAAMLPSSTATIALIDPDRDTLSIQHVSDSFALVRLIGGEDSLLTTDRHDGAEGLFETIRELAKSEGMTNREARMAPEIQRLLIERRQKTHNPPDGSGIGVVNGSPEMDHYVEYRSIPLSSIRLLLLGSDGLPAPQHPISKPEGRGLLLDLADGNGLEHTIDFKKQQEDSDPDWTTVRWKHSDDATGVLIRFR